MPRGCFPESPGSADELEDITRYLREWSSGNDQAFRDLLPLVYSRLQMVARACMRHQPPDHTLQSTALVGELYLKVRDCNPSEFADRQHFYSFCARTMRWILNDHMRKRLAGKRDAALRIPFTEDLPWLGQRESDTLDLDRALEKLAALDSRMARIVELRIYIGCTASESAEIMGLSKPTIDRDLTLARAWLCRELRPVAKD